MNEITAHLAFGFPILRNLRRMRLFIRGMVQGVGFRPFIYKLATELELNGWVNNSSDGVVIELEGNQNVLEEFLGRIRKEKPPRASIHSMEYFFLEYYGYSRFKILESDQKGDKTAWISPDMATCPDCLKEISDPQNRRYLYPFTNCTNCGPRFTIVESLPYDRANTTMKNFIMCPDCQNEYQDPRNRRFHAEVNACPACGPHLELWNEQGEILSAHHEALLQAAAYIKEGKIVALKGLGGFQLIVDAGNNGAVERLRQRKYREEKPFALMFPDFDAVQKSCRVSSTEKELLVSPQSPIVLLHRQRSSDDSFIAPSVAPRNPYLGVMLPYTPLHHILMKELGFPIVATSGNFSDEPMCICEKEALTRLRGIADVFLVHNRPIARHMDDSVMRIMMDRPLVMRRARGYAPLPVCVKEETPAILAVGGHLKNTVALSVKNHIFVSQHIGDLEAGPSFSAFEKTIEDFQNLYETRVGHIVCDRHPEYLSTKYAKEKGAACLQVQHHHAHIVSCMAENEITENVLGVAWDGSGYGADGTIWGGEFLISNLSSFHRAGHFLPFKLPGGEKAIKEPRRSALGALYEIYGEKVFEMDKLLPIGAFSSSELRVVAKMLKENINSPATSSAGRIFDAAASLIGLCQKTNFEGQAAMGLEYLIDERTLTNRRYSFEVTHPVSYEPPAGDDDVRPPSVIDWRPMICEIIEDIRSGVAQSWVCVKFHNTLAEIIVAMARRVKKKHVVLSGGCFQNKYLTEQAIARLREEEFFPVWHQRVSPNDGGLALGQLVIAAQMMKE